MLTMEQIKNAVAVIASEYPIKTVLLFGSYAEGRNTPDSDIDLMIEFETEAVSLLTLSAIKYRVEELLSVDADIIHAPLPENSLINPEKVVQIYAA